MRLQPDTIALGGCSFEVRPLTVAQVQAIEPLLLGSETSAATIATAVAILRIALARDHAEAAGELDSLEAGAPEIGAAMAQVLRLGGFLPGEAPAGGGQMPPPASTGAGSTPG